ncbi:MAG: acyl-ACP--UDP-N-acetylglucosamine O-acyltransferase [Prochlorococcaceae cyanobacterium ETNP1_MAG_9]|nr:acyl-ACP--UDP-N-acetylglucosamine O-acyltransferase [Prochlorococcaceae cyanobacterium ETNP1_MAG_9]
MSEFYNPSTLTIDKPPKVHPLAVVDSKAELEQGVVIGPGCVVGADVKIGANTWVGPNVVLDGRLTIGAQNKIFPGACLGLEPQDLKYKGAPTEVFIGDRNTIRECVTINRATEEGEETRIGNSNLLMAYCHLGHNCLLGNRIIMSNGIQVAGHVVIEDRAVIGGCLGIHQFVHIGGLAMVGGMTRVDRDVPPYCLVEGHPGRLRGLNRVGLRRSGFESRDSNESRQLQEVWTLLFRSNYVLSEAIDLAREEQLMPSPAHLCDFLYASIQKGRRGPMPVMKVN